MGEINEFINKIINGDCLTVLKTIPDNSIDCVVTSPPYWACRDYGIDNQIGLEEHPQEYINKIVAVMKELKRVIKETGTIWLNLGDSFGSHKSGRDNEENISKNEGRLNSLIKRNSPTKNLKDNFYKEKNKLLIPYRIAIACQDELGLILRNDITWVKQIINWKTKESFGASMPTSVQDRLNTNSEAIFLFVKNPDYFFDLDAIRVKHKTELISRQNRIDYDTNRKGGKLQEGKIQTGVWSENKDRIAQEKGKNCGDCIMFPLEPSSENHYAMFPKTLPEFCIKAGCPKEVCNKCGKPKQVTQVTQVTHNRVNEREDNKVRPDNVERVPQDWKPKEIIETKEVSCNCNAGFSPGIVLDPFSGGGTTLFVAKHLLRNYIGIEINPTYIKEIQNKRLAQEVL